MLKLSFFFLILLSICISCASQNNTFSSELKKVHLNNRLLAWNEDTIRSIIFSISQSNSFNYSITTNYFGQIKTNLYKGIWRKSNDTIYLSYRNRLVPKSFEHFLIIEIQGHYLIQNIDNYQKHIYLRIMFDPIGGRGYYTPRPWLE